MKTHGIFILDSEEGFRLAEEFKAKLENQNYKVTSVPYGSIGVRIKGVAQ